MKKLMVKLLVILAVIIMLVSLTGCSVGHKNIFTVWEGLGVKVIYRSTVFIAQEKMPEVIEAEKIVNEAIDNLDSTLQNNSFLFY